MGRYAPDRQQRGLWEDLSDLCVHRSATERRNQIQNPVHPVWGIQRHRYQKIRGRHWQEGEYRDIGIMTPLTIKFKLWLFLRNFIYLKSVRSDIFPYPETPYDFLPRRSLSEARRDTSSWRQRRTWAPSCTYGSGTTAPVASARPPGTSRK